ncbi:hypothetical protein [Paenibacillus lentus]|uniref:Uncharacterized protein n=1 Tax=Paenibacillus lentus TaxID=1338368 RepID=A0A3Q8S4Z2_9BACL|nr:hypothetical protein [Paenibacillus lentus]AZK46943.1 hypothetical protein EIM92_12910 [Paenibacillus lentus]
MRVKRYAAIGKQGTSNMKKATAIGGILLMLLVSGCGLQPNEETMHRQQQFPSWIGQSVRGKVYGQSVREHVYSKEVITPP